MPVFTPCRGKTACRDDGERCVVCNRSLVEIGQTRDLIDALAELAMRQNYDNVDEFAAYVAAKLVKKVAFRRAENR